MALTMRQRNRPLTAATTARPVTQRFATKAWELWTGSRDGTAAIDTVRIVERQPRPAALPPPKGIPRARGC
jgi:hypothetical protein